MKLTKNFMLNEFDCRDGSPVPEIYYGNVKRLAKNLQALRDYIGVPIHINSGYRSPSHNKKIGGEKNSKHLTAEAGDLTVRDIAPPLLYKMILFLISEGVMEEGGLGLYKGFVHYDVRGSRARWKG